MLCENKRSARKFFIFFLSFGLFVFSFVFLTPVNVQATDVRISPSSVDVSGFSPSTITLDVRVVDVDDLFGYQFDVTYNSNHLLLTQTNNVTEGPFIKLDGAATYFIPPVTSTLGLIDNTASTRRSTQVGVVGSGTIAQIRFEVNPSLTTFPTTTNIQLTDVRLSDETSTQITSTPYGGTVTIRTCLSGDQKSCGSDIGECQAGTQSCSNYQWVTCTGGTGPVAEVCDDDDDDCDGYDDNAVTDNPAPLTQDCSINHDGECAVGTATCTNGAYVGCPSPQQEICDNGKDENCDGSDSQCLGDINNDNCIDIDDMYIVAYDFGKTSGFADDRADVNGDNEVDIFDLVIVAKDFGSGSAC